MSNIAADWRQEVLFDRASYDQLNRDTNGAGPEIIAAYREVVPLRLAAMLNAITNGQAAELARLAHTSKSASKSLGLLRVASLCDMIEHHGAGIDVTQLGHIVEGEFAAALNALDQIDPDQPSPGDRTL